VEVAHGRQTVPECILHVPFSVQREIAATEFMPSLHHLDYPHVHDSRLYLAPQSCYYYKAKARCPAMALRSRGGVPFDYPHEFSYNILLHGKTTCFELILKSEDTSCRSISTNLDDSAECSRCNSSLYVRPPIDKRLPQKLMHMFSSPSHSARLLPSNKLPNLNLKRQR
jgi:hypothetical protein